VTDEREEGKPADPDRPAAVAASESETGVQPTPARPVEDAQATAAAREATAQATREEAEARVAEVHQEARETDVRRAEEEVAQAKEREAEAEAETEKLSRKERKAREEAEKAAEEARREREQAHEAGRLAQETARDAPESPVAAPRATSGGAVTSPGVGSTTAPRAQAAAGAPGTQTTGPASGVAATAEDRPEILVGAAFAGAFLFAKLLRAITSSDD
jgi:membrane protein involved in colicin uptake